MLKNKHQIKVAFTTRKELDDFIHDANSINRSIVNLRDVVEISKSHPEFLPIFDGIIARHKEILTKLGILK